MSAKAVEATRIPPRAVPTFAQAYRRSRTSRLIPALLATLMCSACAQTPPAAGTTLRVMVRFADDITADRPALLRDLAERSGCGVELAASVAANLHAYRLACPAGAGDATRVLERLATLPGVVGVTPDTIKNHP